MRPLRMCMVCRQRKEKQELIRVARERGAAPFVDWKGDGQGRGMYLCRSAACIEQARKRRAIERAFSCKAEPELYDELLHAVGPDMPEAGGPDLHSSVSE